MYLGTCTLFCWKLSLAVVLNERDDIVYSMYSWELFENQSGSIERR